MASLIVHCAVAYEYAKTNVIENMEDFIKGTLFPDIEDKGTRHFSHYVDPKETIENLYNKVDLNSFVKKFDIGSDFNKGYFLHMLVDYIFYHDYSTQKYFQNHSFENVLKQFGVEYNKLNKPIYDKYPFSLKYIPKEVKQYFNMETLPEPKYMPAEDIFDIIEYCSNFNLEHWYNEIKKGNLPHYNI